MIQIRITDFNILIDIAFDNTNVPIYLDRQIFKQLIIVDLFNTYRTPQLSVHKLRNYILLVIAHCN